jgi:hypothetical protein
MHGGSAGTIIPKCSFLLGLAVYTFSLSQPGHGESDANACRGVDFDTKRPLIASRVTVRPHVNFVKGSDDDAACPTNKDVCRKNAFLVPGDVVLTGHTQGAFTCVAYQSFHTRKQNWTTGWLPTSSLAPVEPIQSPKMADWIGSWSHPGGTISISLARVGNWHRRGTNISRGGRCSQRSARAAVVPAQNMIAFADDGRTPFEKA